MFDSISIYDLLPKAAFVFLAISYFVRAVMVFMANEGRSLGWLYVGAGLATLVVSVPIGLAPPETKYAQQGEQVYFGDSKTPEVRKLIFEAPRTMGQYEVMDVEALIGAVDTTNAEVEREIGLIRSQLRDQDNRLQSRRIFGIGGKTVTATLTGKGFEIEDPGDPAQLAWRTVNWVWQIKPIEYGKLILTLRIYSSDSLHDSKYLVAALNQDIEVYISAWNRWRRLIEILHDLQWIILALLIGVPVAVLGLIKTYRKTRKAKTQDTPKPETAPAVIRRPRSVKRPTAQSNRQEREKHGGEPPTVER